ncbi:MAG: methyl-accepting chemotaxis protein, partial [Sphingomonadaceae bacterium]
MSWFFNLRIAVKLLLSFCLVLSLSVVLGGVAVLQMGMINRTSTALSEHWLPSVRMALTLRSQLGEYRRWELAHMLTRDVGRMQRYEQTMADTRAAMRSVGERYAPLLTIPAQQEQYRATLALWGRFLVEDTRMIEASRRLDKDRAAEIARGESARLYEALTTSLNELVRHSEEGAASASDAATQAFVSARAWIVGLLLLNIALGLLLALWVARIVARPLQHAVRLAQQVAGGDLTAEVEVGCRDETGQMMRALKDMNASLLSIVCRVRAGTEAIAAASGQIAVGNQDLSSRTEQQASSLEETASTMEQLTCIVRQNASHASQASQLAQTAAAIASTGGEMVERVIVTMRSINAASAKIADIIGVIDSIAFQTNILALNAAVESARAGEQGRGFAVVASEVRNLAQRSAGAAKDIKQLINDSVIQVDNGAKLVDQTGVTMREMVASIGRVREIVGQIAQASAEQSTGIEHINMAVEQMDQVTQQNAALVEQAAAAAEAL